MRKTDHFFLGYKNGSLFHLQGKLEINSIKAISFSTTKKNPQKGFSYLIGLNDLDVMY